MEGAETVASATVEENAVGAGDDSVGMDTSLIHRVRLHCLLPLRCLRLCLRLCRRLGWWMGLRVKM